jgi:hypothetical protein
MRSLTICRAFSASINYAPQYYRVPHLLKDKRELEIPKTLLELEGNVLFNFDKKLPEWGITVKKGNGSGSSAPEAKLGPEGRQQDRGDPGQGVFLLFLWPGMGGGRA